MVDPEDLAFGKAAATASLISAELARSVPSGFSRPMRTLGPARPAAARPWIVGLKSEGAVERKMLIDWSSGQSPVPQAASARRR
jgi:hypothetical protein